MTKLKNDAEFYRDQVELLREEADEQQLRSAEHYKNQVSLFLFLYFTNAFFVILMNLNF